MAPEYPGAKKRTGVFSWLRSLASKAEVGIGQALANSTHSEHAERLRAYTTAWRFYKGQQWDFARDDGDPLVTINLMRRIVNAQVAFSFAGGFRVGVPDDPGTPNSEDEERDFVRKALETQWLRNRPDMFCLEMGQMGSVTGDVFLRVSWEEQDVLEEPYARVDLVPSQFVFPYFGGPSGVDRKKLDHVVLLFPRYRDSKQSADDDDSAVKSNDGRQVVYYAEKWYADRVEYIEDYKEVRTVPNPLGEIPIVHIPNFPLAGEFFGQSDIADLYEIQRQLNEKTTDVSDVINYHGSPITLLFGAKPAQIEKSTRRLWAMPEGSSISNLGLQGDLAASTKFLDYLLQMLVVLSEVSPMYFTDKPPSGMSGSALSLMFMSMLNRHKAKVAMYTEGLRRVNRLMLKILSLKDADFGAKMEALPVRNRYRSSITFPSPLPRDESLEQERSKQRLEMGTTSRRREMEMLGMSQKQIDKILADIREENIEQAETEFGLGMKFGKSAPSGNPSPTRPNPDVQGELKSLGAGEDD